MCVLFSNLTPDRSWEFSGEAVGEATGHSGRCRETRVRWVHLRGQSRQRLGTGIKGGACRPPLPAQGQQGAPAGQQQRALFCSTSAETAPSRGHAGCTGGVPFTELTGQSHTQDSWPKWGGKPSPGIPKMSTFSLLPETVHGGFENWATFRFWS